MGKTIVAKKFYSGFDPATDESFTLEPGDFREVSDEKIAQLERDDLIDRFEVTDKAPKPATSKDLSKLTVPELQAKAAELGVDTKDDAGKDLKKADLLKAVEAEVADGSGGGDELDALDRDSLVNLATSIGLDDPGDLDDDELRAGIRSAKGGSA